MRHVETRDRHPGINHSTDDFGRFCGGTECIDYFSLAHRANFAANIGGQRMLKRLLRGSRKRRAKQIQSSEPMPKSGLPFYLVGHIYDSGIWNSILIADIANRY